MHSIGHSHGVSYIGMLLVNTHLQARPNHIVPGDIVATALIHRVELSCSVSVLADAMLVTPQQLRCVFHLGERVIIFINPFLDPQILSLHRTAMILYCRLVCRFVYQLSRDQRAYTCRFTIHSCCSTRNNKCHFEVHLEESRYTRPSLKILKICCDRHHRRIPKSLQILSLL